MFDTTALLDDDNDDHNVEEDEEDPGRFVGDGGEAAAKKWVKVKEVASWGRKWHRRSTLLHPKGRNNNFFWTDKSFTRYGFTFSTAVTPSVTPGELWRL